MSSLGDHDISDKERTKAIRKLARPYFAAVCKVVLDPYLSNAGFRRARSQGDRFRYRRGGCVLEVGYQPYPADYQPRFAVTVGIGAYRGWFRTPRLIGLWQVPSPDRGGNRWHWEFRGPDQLKRNLKAIVRLLDIYAKPLWEDEQRLWEVLAKEWPIYLELANP